MSKLQNYSQPSNGMTPSQRLSAMAKAGYDITYPANHIADVLGQEIEALTGERDKALAIIGRLTMRFGVDAVQAAARS